MRAGPAAARAEEAGEEGGGVGLEDARRDGDAVREPARQQVQHRSRAAALGVAGGEDEARDAGLEDGAGAHGARLERDVERAALQPARDARAATLRWARKCAGTDARAARADKRHRSNARTQPYDHNQAADSWNAHL